MTGASKVPSHRHDLVVVDATFDNHVDLDCIKPGPGGRVDAVKDIGDRKVDIVHCAKDIVIERIETDRDALQAGAAQ
jgi:hypothetical protein